jgi:hypothetical protein
MIITRMRLVVFQETAVIEIMIDTQFVLFILMKNILENGKTVSSL